MAKRNSGRKGRSRKRAGAGTSRAATERVATDDAAPGGGAPAAATKSRPRPRRAEQRAAPVGSYRAPGSVGERPEAPWHPWPLSELLIFVGAIGTIIGLFRGASGAPVLIAGLAAVMIGTLEFTIREHLAGYRAHTAMLAAIPVALFHAVFAVVLYTLGAPRIAWVIVPLAFDVPLFWLIFRPLQSALRRRPPRAGLRALAALSSRGPARPRPGRCSARASGARPRRRPRRGSRR